MFRVNMANVLLPMIVWLSKIMYTVGNFVDGSQNCICVPYWQCKDDLSGIIDDGVDIVDIRITEKMKEAFPFCKGDFDVCCSIKCGQKKIKIQDIDYEGGHTMPFRILGDNNEAEFAEFPWMLAILQERTYRCGASLIHPRVAITAAHCVAENHNYIVRAGEWNWMSSEEALPYQDRPVEMLLIHPQFDIFTLSNDIALLIMDSPFTLAENVGIICIPPSGLTYDGSKCIASGWGRNSSKKGSYPTTLKKVDLPVVSRPRCLKLLREARLGPYFTLDKSFVCAGGQKTKDTCKGDGGSPLICPIEDQPDRFEQVGIVSWGLTCGMFEAPGIYVNIAMFSNWIDKQMTMLNFDTTIYRY